MNKFGMQIERINTIPFTYFHWQNFAILNLFFNQLLWEQLFYEKKCFSNFSNLQRNITSTERLFILDAMRKPCRGVQHAFQRCSARVVLARLKIVLYVDLSRAIWKCSGMPHHSTASKTGLNYWSRSTHHL